ncbi:unnamed protein product, partial [Mesocestoides corti]
SRRDYRGATSYAPSPPPPRTPPPPPPPPPARPPAPLATFTVAAAQLGMTACSTHQPIRMGPPSGHLSDRGRDNAAAYSPLQWTRNCHVLDYGKINRRRLITGGRSSENGYHQCRSSGERPVQPSHATPTAQASGVRVIKVQIQGSNCLALHSGYSERGQKGSRSLVNVQDSCRLLVLRQEHGSLIALACHSTVRNMTLECTFFTAIRLSSRRGASNRCEGIDGSAGTHSRLPSVDAACCEGHELPPAIDLFDC